MAREETNEEGSRPESQSSARRDLPPGPPPAPPGVGMGGAPGEESRVPTAIARLVAQQAAVARVVDELGAKTVGRIVARSVLERQTRATRERQKEE